MLFRPKHPTKVHVWAGISWKGKTTIVIFDGKMNATGFIEVLTAGLAFVKLIPTPSSCKIMTPNTHQGGRDFGLMRKILIGGKHQLSPLILTQLRICGTSSEYVRRVIKPRTKQELISGILQFWDTVDIAKCQRYFAT